MDQSKPRDLSSKTILEVVKLAVEEQEKYEVQRKSVKTNVFQTDEGMVSVRIINVPEGVSIHIGRVI